MKKGKIAEMLGIEYPIFQGGMAWIADAELAAAVSNAGGLGSLPGWETGSHVLPLSPGAAKYTNT